MLFKSKNSNDASYQKILFDIKWNKKELKKLKKNKGKNDYQTKLDIAICKEEISSLKKEKKDFF